MIVVDASIAVKWLLWERDSTDALSFLERFGAQLHAPDLIFVEVAGALVRQANMDKSLAPPISTLLERWLGDWGEAAVAGERITPALLRRASSIAMSLGHPIQDSIYLALAVTKDCVLATADAKFAVRALRIYDKIRLLSDYHFDR